MGVAGFGIAVEQVTATLAREGLPYDVSGDGQTLRLRFGAAAVFIDFSAWQEDGVVVTVHSPVVQDVAADSPEAAVILNRLNELNRSYFFVKFVFRDGMLIARNDLLGGALTAASLLNALYEVAGASNQVAESL